MKTIDKKAFVKDLATQLTNSTSVVLVNYSGLTVSMQQDLKKKLSTVGAQMVVVKNTLFKLAGTEAKMPEEALSDAILAGPTAMVITEADPIAPLQIISKFAKEFEITNFKVGIVEKKFQDKNALETLSKLPGKDVLAAQVVGALSGPMYGIVGVLQANLQKLVFILDQASKK